MICSIKRIDLRLIISKIIIGVACQHSTSGFFSGGLKYLREYRFLFFCDDVLLVP